MSIYQQIEAQLIAKLKAELNLPTCDTSDSLGVQVDFICETDERNIIAEVYAVTGKALSAKKRKIMSDAFKMLYIEKAKGKNFEKYLLLVDDNEFLPNFEKTWQYEALNKLGIHVRTYKLEKDEMIDLDKKRKENLAHQQKKLNE
jgi:hypothetical protein